MSFCSWSGREVYRDHFVPGKKTNVMRYVIRKKIKNKYLLSFILKICLLLLPQGCIVAQNAGMNCLVLVKNLSTTHHGLPSRKQYIRTQFPNTRNLAVSTRTKLNVESVRTL